MKDITKQLTQDKKPCLYSLEAEFWPIPLSKARIMGLSEKWVQLIESQNTRRHILMIRRLVAKSDASSKLKTGDILLSIDGKPGKQALYQIKEEF